MRELVGWQDHVVEYPGRFQEQDLGSGLIQLTPSPGKHRRTPQILIQWTLRRWKQCSWHLRITGICFRYGGNWKG